MNIGLRRICVYSNSFGLRYFSSSNVQSPKKITKIPSKIGFIGDGNMAKAICKSIMGKGIAEPSQIYVSSPYTKNLHIWDTWHTNVSLENGDVAEGADVIFIAVKPQVLFEAFRGIKTERQHKIKNKLFVSILAGVKLATLEKLIKPFEGSRVIRVMPNIPLTVAEGCSAYSTGTNVTEKDIELIELILGASGMCRRIPEDLMNPITALISSGPAFVFLIIEALSDGAVKTGVYRDISIEMAAQMVLGAAKMVLKSGKHPGLLKDEVCSTGGTTIYGMHALEKKGVRGALMDAVEEAVRRAEELGKKTT